MKDRLKRKRKERGEGEGGKKGDRWRGRESDGESVKREEKERKTKPEDYNSPHLENEGKKAGCVWGLLGGSLFIFVCELFITVTEACQG